MDATVDPVDLSRPYFNLYGGCAMSMSAKVDFGVGAGNDPTKPPSQGGVCADVTSNVGTVSYDGGTSSSWTVIFTPPDSGSSNGRYPITLTGLTYKLKSGNCDNKVNTTKSLGTAGAPYVSDQNGDSGPVQYLTVNYGGAPANSVNQPSAANLDVTARPRSSDRRRADGIRAGHVQVGRLQHTVPDAGARLQCERCERLAGEDRERL